MIAISIVGAVAVALLLGPPKLPPTGGRSVPPPEAPESTSSGPASGPTSTSPSAPKSPRSSASTVPPPPPPAPDSAPKASLSPKSAPTPKSAPAAPQPPGPEILADGPKGSAIAPPRLGGGSPPSRTASPASASPGSVGALRLVSTDELSQWDRDDATRTRPVASTAKPSVKNEPTVVRTAAPLPDDGRPRFRRGPNPPERSAAFVLGYRYFRIQDALRRPQDWHVASIEVTPMRRYVRLNLITEFGVEGGEAAAAGDRADLLLMERLGLGMQYPHIVTPFLEFQAGVGGARVELFGRNDIALLYTLGLDVGAQWAVGRVMFLHAAIGWIRPTFVWQGRTASYDRVALKVGVGF